MLTVLDDRTPVRRSQRKACRKRVKAELSGRQLAPRDQLRVNWISGRCRACMRCPKLIAKLQA